MKKSIVSIMLLLSLFFACTGSVFAEPVYGGDLVIGISSELEPASLDAQIDPYDVTEFVSLMLSDQLVTMTESGEFVPSLATSIDVAPDGTKWTFKFREDVVFSDGTPFNAEAVKVNIDRIMDPATKSSSLAGKMGQAKFVSAEVIDDYTLVLNYTGLVATIWQSLAYMPIWSPTALANSGSSFNQVLTSCGPFVLEEFVKGSHIKLVKNEKYNGKAPTQLHDGPAYLDSITLKFVGEDAILAEALGSGEVDLVYRISSQYIAPYEKNDDFTVVEAYEHGTGSLFVMNQEKAPLDDVRVRQALMYAYDLNEMNDRLFDGKGMIGKGLLTSKIACFYEEGAGSYYYDPEKSKALLDEAGWILNESTGIREKDGAKLEIEGIAINPDRLAQLEYMAIKFKEVGVLLTPQLIPGNMQIEKAHKTVISKSCMKNLVERCRIICIACGIQKTTFREAGHGQV